MNSKNTSFGKFSKITAIFLALILTTGFAVAETEWSVENLEDDAMAVNQEDQIVYLYDEYDDDDDAGSYITAFNSDGEEVWRSIVDEDYMSVNEMGYNDGVVFIFESFQDRVIALDSSNGDVLWETGVDEDMNDLQVDNQGNAHIFATEENRFQKVDEDGTETYGELHDLDIVDVHGNEVYVIGTLVDGDPTGLHRWDFDSEQYIELGHGIYDRSLNIHQGYAITGGEDGYISKQEILEEENDNEDIWDYQKHTEYDLVLDPVVIDDEIYSIGFEHIRSSYFEEPENSDFEYDHGDEPEMMERDDGGSLYFIDENDDFHLIDVLPVPVADFSFPTDLGESVEGEGIGFTDDSDPVSDEIVDWTWSIDGETYDVENPEHVFEESGDYPVELTVENDEGETDTIEQTVSVNSVPNAGFEIINEEIEAGESVEFQDQSTDEYTGEIAERTWTIGDETIEGEENIVREFDAGEEYNVTLEVADAHGAKQKVWKHIEVPSDAASAAYIRGRGTAIPDSGSEEGQEPQGLVQEMGNQVSNFVQNIVSLFPF